MPTTRLYQAVLRDPGPTLGKRLRRAFSTWVEGLGFPEISISPHVEHELNGVRVLLEARNGCGRFLLEDARIRTRVTYSQSLPGVRGWVVITVEQYAGEHVEAYAPGFVPAYLATERITDGGVQVTGRAEEHDEDGIVYLIGDLSEKRRRVPVVIVSVDVKNGQAARANAEHLAQQVAGVAQVVYFPDVRAQDRFNGSVGPDCAVYGGGVRTYLAGMQPGQESYPDRHRVMGGKLVRDQGRHALDLAAGFVIGETAPQKLPDDIRDAYRLVGRIIQGEAPPDALVAAARPKPVRPEFANDALYRRMMAMAADPAPTPVVPEPRPAPEPIPAPAPEPPVPEPLAVDLDQLAKAVAERMAETLAGVADTVAGTVVKDLREELEATLDLISSTAAADPDQGKELARQMRTMNTHVSSLSTALEEARQDKLRANSQRDAAESETDRLEDMLEQKQAEYRSLERDLSESAARERKLESRIRQLEAELAKGAPSAVVEPVEEPTSPNSLAEALHHAAETLTHVEIGGDAYQWAGVLDLGFPGQARTWAGKTWDALLALDDFARARSSGEFSGGFRDWCMSSTGGRRVISAAMIAMKESDSVSGRDKYSAPRTFPVPVEVHPDGKVFMPAHIKLRKSGSPAPRIHFYDDSGGATGKVWVGYVGDHLPNTRTN